MDKAIKIVLADDQPLFTAGLRMVLEQGSGVEIVGEALNGIQLVYLVQELAPDVVITDIEMPEMDGTAATKKLKALYPKLGIIALTVFGEDWRVLDMLQAGARGYLLKNSTREDVLTAIRAVEAGGYYFCRSTNLRLAQLLAHSGMALFRDDEESLLTDTEKKIVALICRECSSKQIAEELNLSTKTVENYRLKIAEKTGAVNVAGVVVYAIKHGIYRV